MDIVYKAKTKLTPMESGVFYFLGLCVEHGGFINFTQLKEKYILKDNAFLQYAQLIFFFLW